MTSLLRFLFYLLFVYSVVACGVTQHNLIAHKALNWFQPSVHVNESFGIFSDILQNNQDSFQAGAAFPDWGYSCGESDASEMAHWPPFTLAYSQFFKSQCGNIPTTWSTDCQQLVAFIFGVVSHQTADVLWHDLKISYPTYQGFLQAMGNTDFDGSFGTAHGIGDAGAEFIVAREFDLSFIQRNWYVPSGFLSDLYQKLGQDITEEKLIECNLLLYAEVHAVKEFGTLLYPYAGRKSAFLTDELLNYWIGGVDDNAIWTQTCWYEYLMYWLTADNDSMMDYPLCLAQEPLFSFSSSRKPTVSPEIRRLAEELIINGDIKTDKNSDKIVFTNQITQDSIEIIQETFQIPKYNEDEFMETESCRNSMEDLHVYSGSIPYSYVGWSFSSGDLNQDGISDLLVGAPGWSNNGVAQLGGIYFIYGDNNLSQVGNTTLSGIPHLSGSVSEERFGWASAIIDINTDGINDIVVSSPSYTASSLTYKGKLSVFFGNSIGTYSSSPNITITTPLNYTNLGYKMDTFDCDGDGFLDLLVTAPFAAQGQSEPQQMGKVYVLLSSNNTFISGQDIDIESNSALILEGDHSNVQFGRHIKVVEGDTLNPSMILVGAPTTSASSDNVESGAIYAYNLDRLMNGHSQSSCLLFSINGGSKWDQVGYSFDIGEFRSYSKVLALSAPGRTTGFDEEQFGAVYFFDLTTISGNNTIESLENIIIFSGDQKFARFGYSCIFDANPSNSSWWISQPRRNFNKENPEAGAFFNWIASKEPLTTHDPVKSSDYCLSSTEGKYRFAESSHFVDLDGNGITDVIIGSPRMMNQLQGSFSILFR